MGEFTGAECCCNMPQCGWSVLGGHCLLLLGVAGASHTEATSPHSPSSIADRERSGAMLG